MVPSPSAIVLVMAMETMGVIVVKFTGTGTGTGGLFPAVLTVYYIAAEVVHAVLLLRLLLGSTQYLRSCWWWWERLPVGHAAGHVQVWARPLWRSGRDDGSGPPQSRVWHVAPLQVGCRA